MPVYVYKNLRTGETFEVEQRISEPALTSHPQSGDPVKRLIQPVGISFKGSGFYVTDSRKASSSSDSGKSSDSVKPSDSGTKKEKADTSKSEGAKAVTSSD